MANRTLIYSELDDNLREASAHTITLAVDGSVDLSQMPKRFQESWTRHGLSSDTNQLVFPKDGDAFLNTLLQRANAYFRIKEVE